VSFSVQLSETAISVNYEAFQNLINKAQNWVKLLKNVLENDGEILAAQICLINHQ
jgi:hypothetical protein